MGATQDEARQPRWHIPIAAAVAVGLAGVWWLVRSDRGPALSPVATFSVGDGAAVKDLAFSPTGDRLAVLTGAEGEDAASGVQVWDGRGPELVSAFPEGYDLVEHRIAYAPDRDVLVAGAQVWDAARGELLVELSDQSRWDVLAIGVAVSPDGGTIATGDSRRVVLWNAVTGERQGDLSCDCPPGAGAYEVAFSADGRLLAAAHHESRVLVWDLVTEDEVGLTPHDDDREGTIVTTSVAFAPDGRRLAAATMGTDQDGEQASEVWLWDDPAAVGGGDAEPDGTLPRRTGEMVTDLAFSPDGELLAAVAVDSPPQHGSRLGAGTALVWDVADRSLPATLEHSEDDAVTAVAFSPDGELLATGGADGDVRLWRHGTRPLSVAFMTSNPLGLLSHVVVLGRVGPGGTSAGCGGRSRCGRSPRPGHPPERGRCP